MARIRSIHPGQWTDEDFAELSFGARLLALGLRCEADDRGCFEWKPKRIKMRLFPGDNVNMDALLAELVEHNQITRYEADGRIYGAIRNFLSFQRPQKPSYYCPAPPEIMEYVNEKRHRLRESDPGDDGQFTEAEAETESDSATSPLPVSNHSNTSRGIAPQKGGREEGKKGGRKEDLQRSTASSARGAPQGAALRQPEMAMAGASEPPPLTLPDELSPSATLGDEVADILAARAPAWARAGIHAARWTAPRPGGLGMSPAAVRDVARAIRLQRDATGQPPPTSPAYLDGPMADAAASPNQRGRPNARAPVSAFGRCPEIE